jgi:2,3-bisphosphoglycerate-dependent phosphoglycerate mutase
MLSDGARLWLVRHGETDWNVQRIVQGQTPTELNDVGRKQARQLANFFADREFSAAYSSDLPRAYQTAEIILAGRGLDLQQDVRLRERSLGKYQGMKSADVHAVRTALGLDQTGDLADWKGMPGVETNQQVWERARDAMRNISDKHHGKDVLVVAHGGLMAQVITEVLGISRTAPRRFPLSNGMIVVLQWRVDAFYMLGLLDVSLAYQGKSSVDTQAAEGGN